MWTNIRDRLPESSGWYVISLPMPWEDSEDAVHVALYDAEERKFYEPLATGRMQMPTNSINAWRPLPKRRPSDEHSFKRIAEGWIHCRQKGTCDGCPIEYDCDDMDVFKELEEWLEYIIDATEDRDVSNLSRDEWTEILGI